MRTLILSFLLTFVLAGVALAQDTTTPAGTPPSGDTAGDKPAEVKSGIDSSRFVVRGGIHLDGSGAINLGGTSDGARAALGANVGVGYFVVPRFELDLDVNFTMRFAPSPVEVENLELTPGARWRPIDQLQLRAGVPIPLVPQAGVGILAGAAYVQPLGDRVSLVAGVDYTYWFTEYWRQKAPLGRIAFHGGVQARF